MSSHSNSIFTPPSYPSSSKAVSEPTPASTSTSATIPYPKAPPPTPAAPNHGSFSPSIFSPASPSSYLPPTPAPNPPAPPANTPSSVLTSVTKPPPTPNRKPTLLDLLKPRRASALLRLRQNILASLVLVLLSTLVPFLPGPLTWIEFAVWGERRVSVGWFGWASGRDVWSLVGWGVVGGREDFESSWGGYELEIGFWTRWMCRIQLTLLLIFTLNILQSLYALRHPPPPLPPIASPARRAMESMVAKRSQNIAQAQAQAQAQTQSSQNANQRQGQTSAYSSPVNPLTGIARGSVGGNGNGSGKKVQFSPSPFSPNPRTTTSGPFAFPASPSPPLSHNNSNNSHSHSPLSNSNFSSSFSSSFSSLSSPLAGYSGYGRSARGGGVFGRGGRTSVGMSGRPIDGSFLARLQAVAGDEDD